MSPRKKAGSLIPEGATSSPIVQQAAASGPVNVAPANESGSVGTQHRAKPLTPADLSEPERQWRREQVLRVLAEILRNPDSSEDR